jgi:hypothetical protein|nr:hypothetical protein [Neorhizobium tomejilense]
MPTESFKNDRQEVAAFLAKPKGSPMERLKELQTALEKPDGLPGDDPTLATVTQLRTHEPIAPQTSPAQQAPEPAMGKPAAQPDLDNAPDATLEIPEPGPNKGGRPLLGTRPKVEKTFAIDEDIHQFLIEVSNWEGIRHKKKFSVSHMMNHALMFAIAHMNGTHMIPINGKDGLVIPEKPSKETEQ